MSFDFKSLLARAGKYVGEGINHEKEKFTGTLTLVPVLGTKGLALEFSAVGDKGIVFHAERSMIGPSLSEKLGLWVISTNHPGVVPHELRRGEALSGGGTRLIFGFGDVQNGQSFREEIALDLHANGDVGYIYFWGLPGGEFQERSGARLKRV